MQSISAGASLTEDITIYAKWNQKTVSVSGYSGGGGRLSQLSSETQSNPQVDQKSESHQEQRTAYERAYKN